MYSESHSKVIFPEELVRLDDQGNRLSGVIVLHSTTLGPAAGGCRIMRSASEANATIDAVRLAEEMSFKNAMAGLPFGGGKAVIRAPDTPFDRAALFKSFGRLVASLDGRYLTSEDIGTSANDMMLVSENTCHVAGLAAKRSALGRNPSAWTALGVFRAMEVAVRRRLGAELRDVAVAVQGVGSVGFSLCRLLHEAGARLIIAEPRSQVAAHAATMFDSEIMTSHALIAARAEVFAPCAIGGVVNSETVHRLRAKVVCGGADNQLATAQQGRELAARGILYAPDYVVNAGGMIKVAGEHLGWPESEVRSRVAAIAERLEEVLNFAEHRGLPPHEACDTIARSIIMSKPLRRLPRGEPQDWMRA